MKRLLCAVFCILTFATFTVSAKSDKFEVKAGKEYTAVYKGDDFKSIAEITDMTENELEKYFEDNNIEYFAVDKSNSRQIHVANYKSDFSELVGDMSSLTDENVDEIASELASENEKHSVTERAGVKYAVLTKSHKDSGGVYTVTQFCTVAGGEMYQLSVYTPDSGNTDEAYEILKSFKLKDTDSGGMPIFETLLIVFGIAAFAAIAVVMAIWVFKILKTPKSED